MDKEFRKICIAYLNHAEENGIRRIYETLPEWVKENYPKVYARIPEFGQLELVPGKNDHRYRGSSEKYKIQVRRKRIDLWEGLAKRIVLKRSCSLCGVPTTHTWGRRMPVSLKEALHPSDYCSVKCAKNSPEVKAKTEATNLRKYGVTCTLNSKEGIRKKTATWMKNYGVSNPSQAPEIVEKLQRNRYGRKEITLNGKTFQYQGYEAAVLRRLAPKADVKAFTSKASDVGMFSYMLGGKERKYLPDIKVTLQSGRVYYIEIKSVATLNATKAIGRKVKSKAKAMWSTHGLNYIVALCGEDKIIEKARNYDELKSMMARHRKWS